MLKFHLSHTSWTSVGFSLFLVTSGLALPGHAQSTLNGTQPASSLSQSSSSMPSLMRVDAAADSTQDWSENYRLGPGDVIKIEVFGAEEYSGEAVVLQDGAISLPRAGRVLVQGQTFQQASEAIANTYLTYIRNPMITVTPIKLRPIRVAISGEVSRPGSYTIEPTKDNQEQNFPTLTQIISQAGGITARANLKRVEIRRPTGSDQTQTSTINLWDLVRSSDLSQDIVLQSGDEVYIPTAANLSAQEMTELASANFAPDSIQVYVTGEVARPGVVQVPLNTPLNQAISAAGGFNQTADRQSVNLVRLNPNGTATKQNISVNASRGISEEDNPPLMDQDVVVVHRSGLATFGQVAGMMLSPLSQIINTIFGFQGLFR